MATLTALEYDQLPFGSVEVGTPDLVNKDTITSRKRAIDEGRLTVVASEEELTAATDAADDTCTGGVATGESTTIDPTPAVRASWVLTNAGAVIEGTLTLDDVRFTLRDGYCTGSPCNQFTPAHIDVVCIIGAEFDSEEAEPPTINCNDPFSGTQPSEDRIECEPSSIVVGESTVTCQYLVTFPTHLDCGDTGIETELTPATIGVLVEDEDWAVENGELTTDGVGATNGALVTVTTGCSACGSA